MAQAVLRPRSREERLKVALQRAKVLAARSAKADAERT